MKKYLVLLGMVLTLGLAVGCGNKENLEAETATKIVTNIEEGKVVTGVIDEIAEDYYFSIQVEDGTYYQFPLLEENDFELGDAGVGDKIKLIYDGELSEVDMFDGTLLGCELVE